MSDFKNIPNFRSLSEGRDKMWFPQPKYQRARQITSLTCGAIMLMLTIPDIRFIRDIRLEWEWWLDGAMALREPPPPPFVAPKLKIIDCFPRSWPVLWAKKVLKSDFPISEEILTSFQKRMWLKKYPTMDLREAFKDFWECISFQTDGKAKTEQEQQMMLDMIYRYLWLFPREILPDRIEAIITQRSLENLWEAYIDERSAIIQAEEIWSATVPHELTHLIFKHRSGEYERKYSTDLWPYDRKNPSNFVDTPGTKWKYGMTNIREDMATVWERIFDQPSWKRLRIEMKNPNIRKKVQLVIQYFWEVSDGMMDETYFSLIEQGKITNAVDAQKYFQAKRVLRLVNMTEEQRREYEKRKDVQRIPLVEKWMQNWYATYWIK